MADETTQEVDEQQAQDANQETETTEQQTEEAHNVEGLPKWAQDLFKDLRQENAKHRKAKTEAEKAKVEAERKAAEDQGKFQELYQTERERNQQLEAEIAQLKLDGIRSDVALKHRLPPTFVSRLKGDTFEDMEKDALEMIEAMPKKPANADASAGAHSRSTGLRTVEEVKKNKQSRDYNAL